MSRCLILILSLLAASLALAVQSADADELVVSAAASLTDVFRDIEPAFEAAHPGVDVILNFAASGALYRQIEQGAPVDVYASANPLWMARCVEQGLVTPGQVTVFARNALVLAVPEDNPADVRGVEDLTTPAVQRVGIGSPRTVPAGQYAQNVLRALGLYDRLKPKLIFGESVRQVLDYLVRGEVDCGFVYRTDGLRESGRVRVVRDLPMPEPVTYPMAPLAKAPHPALARAFVEFVRGEAGVRLLERRGFLKP